MIVMVTALYVSITVVMIMITATAHSASIVRMNVSIRPGERIPPVYVMNANIRILMLRPALMMMEIVNVMSVMRICLRKYLCINKGFTYRNGYAIISGNENYVRSEGYDEL